MNQLIEKFAMQCTSWPYWRDLPNDGSVPADLVTEWPSHVTDEQKAFWRNFVTMMVNDLTDELKSELVVGSNSKLDNIISILNTKLP